MKYKEQALYKIEKISNKIASLDSSISRASTIEEIRDNITLLKEMVDDLRGMINNEEDGLNF
jgi:hypothetical protein